MKAIALVVSARKRGNCHQFAEFVLDQLKAAGAETELMNLGDLEVTPCQGCCYECLQHLDPQKKVRFECPIEDDVHLIWEKLWNSEILFLFVPTYGGLPPASCVALTQRTQGLSKKARKKEEEKVVSCLVLASPHWPGIAEFTPLIMAEEMKWMGRKVAAFEVINNAGFKTENVFGGLINEEEIRRRLEFIVDRTLEVSKLHFRP